MAWHRAEAPLTSSLDSWFFRKGQVIETLRGKGIYQAAIDEASKKLDDGRWVRVPPPDEVRSTKFSHD